MVTTPLLERRPENNRVKKPARHNLPVDDGHGHMIGVQRAKVRIGVDVHEHEIETHGLANISTNALRVIAQVTTRTDKQFDSGGSRHREGYLPARRR